MDIQLGHGKNNLVAKEVPAYRAHVRREQEKPAAAEKNTAALPQNNQLSKNTADTADTDRTVKELERIGLAFNKKLRFKVDNQTHEVTVKVIDPETDKVIRELPSKELQHLRDRIRETIGFLFDEHV
jgi:flagellar protein FlaG